MISPADGNDFTCADIGMNDFHIHNFFISYNLTTTQLYAMFGFLNLKDKLASN